MFNQNFDQEKRVGYNLDIDKRYDKICFFDVEGQLEYNLIDNKTNTAIRLVDEFLYKPKLVPCIQLEMAPIEIFVAQHKLYVYYTLKRTFQKLLFLMINTSIFKKEALILNLIEPDSRADIESYLKCSQNGEYKAKIKQLVKKYRRFTEDSTKYQLLVKMYDNMVSYCKTFDDQDLTETKRKLEQVFKDAYIIIKNITTAQLDTTQLVNKTYQLLSQLPDTDTCSEQLRVEAFGMMVKNSKMRQLNSLLDQITLKNFTRNKTVLRSKPQQQEMEKLVQPNNPILVRQRSTIREDDFVQVERKTKGQQNKAQIVQQTKIVKHVRAKTLKLDRQITKNVIQYKFDGIIDNDYGINETYGQNQNQPMKLAAIGSSKFINKQIIQNPKKQAASNQKDSLTSDGSLIIDLNQAKKVKLEPITKLEALQNQQYQLQQHVIAKGESNQDQLFDNKSDIQNQIKDGIMFKDRFDISSVQSAGSQYDLL